MIFGPATLPPPLKKEDWHPFFVLWPRHLAGVGYVWLQVIERKSRWYGSPGGGFWEHEYRLPDPPWACRRGDHEWAYLKSPSGVPMFKDYCVRCKRRPHECTLN